MSNLEYQISRLNAALEKLEAVLEPVIQSTLNVPMMQDREEVMALLEDRAQLAEELDQALAREADLQAMADEASEALGQAIDEVRVVMSQTTAEKTHR